MLVLMVSKISLLGNLDIYIFNIFNIDEISKIIGKENTVHLCVKTGNMANIIINSIAQYNNYIR